MHRTPRHLSAPRWRALSPHIRDALERVGVDAAWCSNADDVAWMSALNLHAKLQAMDLWRFVSRAAEPCQGCLEFYCDDLEGLCEALRRRADFTTPRPTDGFWDVRERRVLGSLHLKHFEGWPQNRLQSHIDRFGLWVQPWWWLISPLVPLGTMALHGLDPRGYQAARCIRALLWLQGVALTPTRSPE